MPGTVPESRRTPQSYGSNRQGVTVTSRKMVTILAAILDGFYWKFSVIELAGIETKPYVFFLEIKTMLYLNFAVLGTVFMNF